jgi:hypothetical protein
MVPYIYRFSFGKLYCSEKIGLTQRRKGAKMEEIIGRPVAAKDWRAQPAL